MVRISVLFIAVFMSFAGFTATAEDEVTHIVVSGQSGESKSFELLRYNRIVFGEKSMYVSSSENSGNTSGELLYSKFNHIEFANDILSGIEETMVQDASLVYIAEEKALAVMAEQANPFELWVFNSTGMNLCHMKTMPGEKVYMKSYSPGVYIAVAVSDEIQLKTKFIIR